jgi:MCP family monocarboxylic acid transporter-like MFS transporter 10
MSTSPPPRPVSPFPPLAPILSRFSLAHTPSRLRDDGYDNFPPPLPHDPAQLERRLTTDPDLQRQMAIGPGNGVGDEDIGPPPEGGREAWSCVAAAFFLLFTIFGFCESFFPFLTRWVRRGTDLVVTSFGTLQEYYLNHQLSDYKKSDVA